MSESIKEIISNRKASFSYEILETFEAGIVLMGTEIKSLRIHGGSLQESYVTFKQGDLVLVGSSIPPYSFGNIHNHEERRDRKLLMHSYEMEQLKRSVEQSGLTIIPLSLYLKNGRAKMKIALARGKKLHDKRASIKERDQEREIRAHLKKGY